MRESREQANDAQVVPRKQRRQHLQPAIEEEPEDEHVAAELREILEGLDAQDAENEEISAADDADDQATTGEAGNKPPLFIELATGSRKIRPATVIVTKCYTTVSSEMLYNSVSRSINDHV